MERIAPSERVARELADLVDGKTPVAQETQLRGLLLKLGAQRVLQELLEAEQRDFLGVERYERNAERRGQRNGYEPTHADAAEGRFEPLGTPGPGWQGAVQLAAAGVSAGPHGEARAAGRRDVNCALPPCGAPVSAGSGSG